MMVERLELMRNETNKSAGPSISRDSTIFNEQDVFIQHAASPQYSKNHVFGSSFSSVVKMQKIQMKNSSHNEMLPNDILSAAAAR